MPSLVPYLIFNGDCQDAMQYYVSLFDGEITKLQLFEDAPIKAPPSAADRVFDAELEADNLTIKGSDSFPGQEVQQGTNISMFLNFDNRDDQKRVYHKLAEDGEIKFELNEESGFAMVRDKFGISWMLAYHP